MILAVGVPLPDKDDTPDLWAVSCPSVSRLGPHQASPAVSSLL